MNWKHSQILYAWMMRITYHEQKGCLLASLPLSTACAWLATLMRYDNTIASVRMMRITYHEQKGCLLAALPLSTACAWLATLMRYDSTIVIVIRSADSQHKEVCLKVS